MGNRTRDIPSTLDLVRMAIKEWGEGVASADETLMKIAIVTSVQHPPSIECRLWAENEINKLGLNDI